MSPADLAHALLVAVVFLLMLAGLAGTVVPLLPGLVLIWGAALLYGLGAGFGAWGPWLFALMTLLMLFGYGVSWLVSHLCAAKTGASLQAILASLVLAIVGFFVVPVVGAPLGALSGVFLVEYLRRKDVRAAWRATAGAVVGFGIGFGLEIAIGLLMIFTWGLWVVVEGN